MRRLLTLPSLPDSPVLQDLDLCQVSYEPTEGQGLGQVVSKSLLKNLQA